MQILPELSVDGTMQSCFFLSELKVQDGQHHRTLFNIEHNKKHFLKDYYTFENEYSGEQWRLLWTSTNSELWKESETLGLEMITYILLKYGL